LHQPIQRIGDVIDIINRRKFAILLPFLVVFTIAGVIAFVLPARYKSSTTILIENQQVPSDLVQSTVNTLVEEAIQTITQRIMSRSKLEEIIDRFNLYEDLRKRKTLEEIIVDMREDIRLKTISAEVVGSSGRPGIATIAFSLSYEGKDPGKVQKVTNTLASLYLEENLRTREQKARITTDFLELELKTLNDNINLLESKIARFKNANLEALPEMQQFNFQAVQRLEGQIDNLEQSIRNLEERKIYLQGQLATIEPDLSQGIDTPQARLKRLYTQYASAKAILLPDHPDLIRLKKEIASLEEDVNLADSIRMKQNELQELSTALASERDRLSAKHPDIVRLNKSIAVLREEIRQKQDALVQQHIQTRGPGSSNPAYINLNTQIETTDLDIANIKKERQRLNAELEGYRGQLARTPQIEQAYRMLTRDYENARLRYQETLSKHMIAKSAEGLEKGQKGQRFTIIDTAVLPQRPFKPNRLAIVVVGFVLGIGAGAGLAVLREMSDHAIRSEMMLAYLTEKPVLAVVPRIVTAEDRRRKRIRIAIHGLCTATAAGLCVFAVHALYSPLDVLWFRILRKLVSYGVINP
jgi:succinoglycan biosynthesis transport protein ExoP